MYDFVWIIVTFNNKLQGKHTVNQTHIIVSFSDV